MLSTSTWYIEDLRRKRPPLPSVRKGVLTNNDHLLIPIQYPAWEVSAAKDACLKKLYNRAHLHVTVEETTSHFMHCAASLGSCQQSPVQPHACLLLPPGGWGGAVSFRVRSSRERPRALPQLHPTRWSQRSASPEGMQPDGGWREGGGQGEGGWRASEEGKKGGWMEWGSRGEWAGEGTRVGIPRHGKDIIWFGDAME